MRKRGFVTLGNKRRLARRRLALGTLALALVIFMSGVAFAFDSSGRLDIEGTAQITIWHEVLWPNAHEEHVPQASEETAESEGLDEAEETAQSNGDYAPQKE